MEAAACATQATGYTYARREPEKTALYKVLQQHLLTFEQEWTDKSDGRTLPSFVTDDIEELAYVDFYDPDFLPGIGSQELHHGTHGIVMRRCRTAWRATTIGKGTIEKVRTKASLQILRHRPLHDDIPQRETSYGTVDWTSRLLPPWSDLRRLDDIGLITKCCLAHTIDEGTEIFCMWLVCMRRRVQYLHSG